MDENRRNRPPAVPQELLNRPRPRGIISGNQVQDPFTEQLKAVEAAVRVAVDAANQTRTRLS